MPLRIPIVGGRPPEPPAYGGLGEAGWARGRTFLEAIEAAGEQCDAWEAAFAAVEVAADVREFFASFPRRVRVLVLGDPAATDTRVNVAQAENLFAAGKSLWMRLFSALESPDLVRLFATGRELPLFVFFGDDRREFARWGPRPHALQELERRTPAPPTAVEAHRLDWYAANRGRDLALEIRDLLVTRLGG
jgi:thioredoxin family protein